MIIELGIEEAETDKDVKQINELMAELADFNKEWNAYLKQGKIDEERIKDANNSVLKLHSKIDMELMEVNKDAFNYTSCKFKKNNQGFISDDFIGNLEIKQLDGYKENLERKKRETAIIRARKDEENRKVEDALKPKTPSGVMSSLDSVSIGTNATDKSKPQEIERVTSSQLRLLEMTDDTPSDPLMTNYNSFGYSKPNASTRLPKVIRVSPKNSARRDSDDSLVGEILKS